MNTVSLSRRDLLIVIWDSLTTFMRFMDGTIPNIILASSVSASGAFALSTQISKKCPFPIILESLALLGAASSMFLPHDSKLIMGRAPRYLRVMVSSLIGAARNAGIVMEVVALETVASLTIRRQGQVLDVHDHAAPKVQTLAFHQAMHFGVLFCIIAAIFSATARAIDSGSDQDMVGL